MITITTKGIPTMPKISKKASNAVSQIFTVIIFVLLVAALFLLPYVLGLLIEVFDKPPEFFAPTLIILYVLLIPAFAADVFLFMLLGNIRKNLIFTQKSVLYLRIISWCCIAAGAILFALGFYYFMVFLISFAAVFIGVILRVVKNVIEEATEIKSENDFTI